MPARVAIAAGALALVAWVYGPSLGGGFVWDDVTLIRDNAFVHSFAHIPRLLRTEFWATSVRGVDSVAVHYYRPVVSIGNALLWRLGGGDPLAYRLTNLALHLACVTLGLRWLGARVTGAPPLAWALALALLAVHPTRVESVAWISGSTDLWVTALMLLAATTDRPWRVAVFALLAAGAKESAALLPLMLLADAAATDDLPARGSRLRGAAAAAAVVAAVFAARLALVPLTEATLRPSLATHVATVAASLGMLLARIVWPLPAGFGFAELPADDVGALRLPGWAVALGAAAALACAAAVARWSRHAGGRHRVADLAWLLLPMVPALNLVPRRMPDLVSDRMLYTAMLGVAALTLRGLAALHRRSPAAARALGVAGLAALVLGCVPSARRARALRDDTSLWRYEVATFPDRPRALVSLAKIEAGARRHMAALRLIGRGLQAATEARSRDAQIDLMVLSASVLTDRAPDADQRTLLAVRGFLDALADPSRPRARLDAGGVRLQIQLQAGEPEILRRLDRHWAETRALVALRTLDHGDAAARYGALTARSPTDPAPWIGLALAHAAQRRWAAALAAADRSASLGASGATVAATLRSPACREAAVASLAELVVARCYLRLRLFELARQTTLALGRPPATPEAIELLLDADLAEGVYARARARVARDGARFPAYADRWGARVDAASSTPR